jgi:uncharacterized protein (DUF58 family)
VQNQEIREKLEASSDKAAQKAVRAAIAEQDIHVMFLIDRSGSMQGALEKSVEALSRILAGFEADRVHIASFDTMGVTHRPKAASRVAVQHMLASVTAGGGTLYSSALRALHRDGVRIPSTAKLVVIAVGDEDGEDGAQFARAFGELGYAVGAIALILNVVHRRGNTVINAARALGVPFSTVEIEQFDDPYQVPRVLQTILEAPSPSALPGVVVSGWVEKVMSTPLLDIA